ncbi:MAG: hypothetical protein Q7R41_13555 [Phycisphaerales bacterium]|nr:hypothetical protein [Phycisphaerales bacterium]
MTHRRQFNTGSDTGASDVSAGARRFAPSTTRRESRTSEDDGPDTSGKDREKPNEALPTDGSGGTPVPITRLFPVGVLALGVDRQNTVCLGRGQSALLSEMHGDLNRPEEFRRFLASSAKLERSFGDGVIAIGHDLHSALLTTLHAHRITRLPRKSVAVQHHHAHAISCALDAGVELPVIAVVCDGSGYGLDRAIWGGEVLCCEAESFVRLAHLDYFPLPGGEAAIRSPWRSAMGVVNAAMPEDWSSVSVPTFSGVDAQQRRIATRQLETGCDTIPTSSLGRLFDAVAVLLELCRDDTPDGQAAGALEALAGVRDCPPYRLTLDGLALALSKKGTSVRLNWRPMMREMMADIARGVDPSVISARFHATIVTMLAEAAEWGVRTTGIDRVVLSGGCFANQRLRTGLIAELRMRGIEAKTHVRVPTGDAGISLGQAFVASSVVARTGGVRAPAFTPGGIRPA